MILFEEFKALADNYNLKDFEQEIVLAHIIGLMYLDEEYPEGINPNNPQRALEKKLKALEDVKEFFSAEVYEEKKEMINDWYRPTKGSIKATATKQLEADLKDAGCTQTRIRTIKAFIREHYSHL